MTLGAAYRLGSSSSLTITGRSATRIVCSGRFVRTPHSGEDFYVFNVTDMQDDRARRILRDVMGTHTHLQRILLATMTIAVVASVALTTALAMQQPAAAPEPQHLKGVVIRGCLVGSKLTHVDTEDPTPNIPDTLRVSSIRVIRSQVKALNGHQVELIGTLRGIPGQENGLLVTDSDKVRVYIGGGDTSLGADVSMAHNDRPTIDAHTIRDIAPVCTAGQSK